MAQPALADARISCPVCRAPVHPIAGRCKHCKADLVRMRGGSTGAGETPVAVPTLGPGGAPAAAPLPLPGGRGGAAMPALTAVPASTAAPHLALPGAPSPAALPGPGPRLALPAASAPPTAIAPSSGSTSYARTRRWSQRWPLAVAIVAALAILASLAMLLFNGPKKPKTLRPLGPAPERMDTDVGPPPPPAPTPHAPSTTPPPPVGPQGTVPGPGAPSDPSDPFDPPAGSGAGVAPADPAAQGGAPHAPGAIPRVDDVGGFLGAAIDLGCERVLACTSASADAQALCSQARAMRDSAAAALGLSCTHFDAASAQSCLGAIARIPCPGSGTTDPSKLASLLMGVPACARVCGP